MRKILGTALQMTLTSVACVLNVIIAVNTNRSFAQCSVPGEVFPTNPSRFGFLLWREITIGCGHDERVTFLRVITCSLNLSEATADGRMSRKNDFFFSLDDLISI